MSKRKVLAVASAGGHWKELVLLKPAFENFDVIYVTTMEGLVNEDNEEKTYIIRDSNQTDKVSVIISFFQLIKIFLIVKPNYVVTTGASPGTLAILLGCFFRLKTIWVDSIANSEELTLGGRISKYFASVTLTQWEHLADNKKIFFRGSVF